VLQTKHLMNTDVLDAARSLVRRIVDQMMAKLAKEIRQPFQGVRDRRRRTTYRVARNFDLPTTLRRNLKNYDPSRRRVGLEIAYFFSRVKRHMDRWRIIILVDQSGSMVDSVIHSAITASIFKSLPNVKTHLIAFDTQLVDLSEDAGDPVETLMRVQLGGGTDIGKPLVYASSLIDDPRRTIVVLITDLFDGAGPENTLVPAKGIIESGATLLILAALDESAAPTFDKNLGQKMANIGAHVAAMTPGELANWVAARIG
jgi:predicted metal-dependent peptidase